MVNVIWLICFDMLWWIQNGIALYEMFCIYWVFIAKHFWWIFSIVNMQNGVLYRLIFSVYIFKSNVDQARSTINLMHAMFYKENLQKNWRYRGSNSGPFTCKANALPLSYIPKYLDIFDLAIVISDIVSFWGFR